MTHVGTRTRHPAAVGGGVAEREMLRLTHRHPGAVPEEPWLELLHTLSLEVSGGMGTVKGQPKLQRMRKLAEISVTGPSSSLL